MKQLVRKATADQLTHGAVVAQPLLHWLVDPSSCLPAMTLFLGGWGKALPGEEEEDKEGRGEAALHAEMEVQRVGGEAGGAGELQELRFWGDWQQHQTVTVGGSAVLARRTHTSSASR